MRKAMNIINHGSFFARELLMCLFLSGCTYMQVQPGQDVHDAQDGIGPGELYPEGIPVCPDDYRTKFVVVEFFGDSGILPRDAFPSTGDAFVEATWAGVRRLDEPYEVECYEPPSVLCPVETVIGLMLEGGKLMELLLGVPADDLERIPPGRPVRYMLAEDEWRFGPGLNLVVEGVEEGDLILAAMVWERLEYFPEHEFGPLVVRRDPEYVCTYIRYMGCKHYGATALHISTDSGDFRVEPDETIVAATARGNYRITHVFGKDRTCFCDDGCCCSDEEWDQFSYVIVATE
jgi:hypothetical protein